MTHFFTYHENIIDEDANPASSNTHNTLEKYCHAHEIYDSIYINTSIPVCAHAYTLTGHRAVTAAG